MNFKVGDRVEMFQNTSEWGNWKPGAVGKVIKDTAGTTTEVSIDGIGGVTVYTVDLRFHKTTRQKVWDHVKQLKAELQVEEEKLAFLDEIKQDDFDALEFKCYRAIQALQKDKDPLTCAKELAKIVKGS